jgi:E3 ubiquitin-protein ligase TRIP12
MVSRQDSLGFGHFTETCSSLDSKRSSPSLLARQLRLRLVAGDESDIPRNLHNIVVSIHAIATFQALHDYLRPRVAGLLSSGRLSGMLSALAASGFPPGSSSRNVGEEPRQASAAQDTAPPSAENNTITAPASVVGRRRSLRLSAKHGGAFAGLVDGSSTTPAASNAVANTTEPEPPSQRPVFPPPDQVPASEATLSDTVVDSELQADFTDDEVDAEVIALILICYPYLKNQVFDDDADPETSISEKTVTLSIVEGIL